MDAIQYLLEVNATLSTDQNAFRTGTVWLIHGEMQQQTLPGIRAQYYCLNALVVYLIAVRWSLD